MPDDDTLTGSLSYGLEDMTLFVEDDDPENVVALVLDDDDDDWEF